MTLTDPLARGLARLRLLPDPAEHRPLLELIDERIDDMTPASALLAPRRRDHDNDYPEEAA